MKDLAITELYDCYSALLSDKQRTVFEFYYDDDLSLSEIAEHTRTTRQGVRDLIKRSEEQLRDFEECLGLNKKYTRLREIAAECENRELAREIEAVISEN